MSNIQEFWNELKGIVKTYDQDYYKMQLQLASSRFAKQIADEWSEKFNKQTQKFFDFIDSWELDRVMEFAERFGYDAEIDDILDTIETTEKIRVDIKNSLKSVLSDPFKLDKKIIFEAEDENSPFSLINDCDDRIEFEESIEEWYLNNLDSKLCADIKVEVKNNMYESARDEVLKINGEYKSRDVIAYIGHLVNTIGNYRIIFEKEVDDISGYEKYGVESIGISDDVSRGFNPLHNDLIFSGRVYHAKESIHKVEAYDSKKLVEFALEKGYLMNGLFEGFSRPRMLNCQLSPQLVNGFEKGIGVKKVKKSPYICCVNNGYFDMVVFEILPDKIISRQMLNVVSNIDKIDEIVKGL